MNLNEALETLKNAGILTEKAALTVDTEVIDHAIEVLQKHKERLVPIGEEVAKFLPENGVIPTELGIGQDEYSGRYVLWIGMPKIDGIVLRLMTMVLKLLLMVNIRLLQLRKSIYLNY